MALTTKQCREAVVEMVRSEPALATMSKTDLIAAAQAVDTWTTDNATAYNTALPVPFRTTATPAQKAALLSYVALRRWTD